MSDVIRIPGDQFAVIEAEARKTLEAMNPESLDSLRKKCSDELEGLANLIVEARKKTRKNHESFNSREEHVEDNPYRKVVRRYWLTQLVNFILTFIFGVPREFTPSEGFPYGAGKAAKEYDELTDKIRAYAELLKTGIEYFDQSLDGLYEIMRNIAYDDAKLIVFCDSCLNTDRVKSELNVNPNFEELVALLYLNDVSLSAATFKKKLKYPEMTERVSSLIENVKAAYTSAVEEKTVQDQEAQNSPYA